jgi:hypothetical protein
VDKKEISPWKQRTAILAVGQETKQVFDLQKRTVENALKKIPEHFVLTFTRIYMQQISLIKISHLPETTLKLKSA